MNQQVRLLLFCFWQSIAMVMATRGSYFLTEDRFGFSRMDNLWLALAAGAWYVCSAIFAHRVCRRMGEKRVLVGSAVGMTAVYAVMSCWPMSPAVVVVGHVLLCWFGGFLWPVVESYVSAGRSTAGTAKAIGQFNITWAIAVPLGAVAAGPVMTLGDSSVLLFALPLLMSIMSLGLLWSLGTAPGRLPQDHPQRPPADQMAHYAGLMTSTRWMLLHSYMLLFVLTPLLPAILTSEMLGYTVEQATPISSLSDWARLGLFVMLRWSRWWHGRADVIVATIIATPLAFFMVLFGQSPTMVLCGLVLFGIIEGVVYYAALYYAMVVKNASVVAGGVHEALIGAGCALGPLAGLVGQSLTGMLGAAAGMATGIAPAIVVCTLGSLWPLVRGRRCRAATAAPTETISSK